MFSLLKNAFAAEAKPEAATPAVELPIAVPAVDLIDTGHAFVLTADVPGVPANGLEVTVDGDRLTIRAKPNTPAPKDLRLVHDETTPRIFERSFTLSETIDRAAITAKINHGVATITLPRRGALAPRKVQIAIA